MNTTKLILHLPEDVKNAYKELCKSKGTTMSDRLRQKVYHDLAEWNLVGTVSEEIVKVK